MSMFILSLPTTFICTLSSKWICLKSALLDPFSHLNYYPIFLAFISRPLQCMLWSPALPLFFIFSPFSSKIASASALYYNKFPRSLTTTFKTNQKIFLIPYLLPNIWHYWSYTLFFFLLLVFWNIFFLSRIGIAFSFSWRSD